MWVIVFCALSGFRFRLRDLRADVKGSTIEEMSNFSKPLNGRIQARLWMDVSCNNLNA